MSLVCLVCLVGLAGLVRIGLSGVFGWSGGLSVCQYFVLNSVSLGFVLL